MKRVEQLLVGLEVDLVGDHLLGLVKKFSTVKGSVVRLLRRASAETLLAISSLLVTCSMMEADEGEM